MVRIPKQFQKAGVQATEAAKAAVARIENSVKCEVITPDKLVRIPSSDLYDKSAYMNTENFWVDNEYVYNAGEAFVDIQESLPWSGRAWGSFIDYVKSERLIAAARLEKLKPFVEKMRKLQSFEDSI